MTVQTLCIEKNRANSIAGTIPNIVSIIVGIAGIKANFAEHYLKCFSCFVCLFVLFFFNYCYSFIQLKIKNYSNQFFREPPNLKIKYKFIQ